MGVRCAGLFLTLDGPDGGGKSTQAAMLVTWLRAMGHKVVACRDPGGTRLGKRLREILLDRRTGNLDFRAEMLLYMASRAQLIEEVIRPAMEAGRVVVSDRFLLAGIVYQGFAGGLPVEEIGRIGLAAAGRLLPDLTLILDVPLEVAKARVGTARDRIEDRSDAYYARVREGFLQAASEAPCPYYPAPIVVIDASADRDSVAARIISEVGRVTASPSAYGQSRP